MTRSPTASDDSHDSADEGHNEQNSKTHALKDKECPYCHQQFTSSSLGRHLDQFISKKKPDGVHDVEEIKKLRAGITRRTARGAKRNEHQDQQQHVIQNGSSQHSPIQPPPLPQNDVADKSHWPPPTEPKIQRIGWQATGVINDQLPISASTQPVLSPVTIQPASTLAGTKRTFSTYAADIPTSSTNDTTRALELSLREVLDAVNAATRKLSPMPDPFPFDLTAQTFPSLCLLLLPAPATLYQSSPFSTPQTVPLRPPGPDQLQALRSKIKNTIDDWKWNALGHMQKTNAQSAINVGEQAERLSQTAQLRIEEGLQHLDAAYQYFMSNPIDQQYHIWNVELLRAFKTEQEKLSRARDDIVGLTQEAAQLQQQVDYLSRCQWPREMALWPPERNTFSAAVQKNLENDKFARTAGIDNTGAYGIQKTPDLRGQAEDFWDFDKLVNKWKRHVREDRARRGVGTTASVPTLSDVLADRTATPPPFRKSMSESIGMNGQLRSTSQSNSPNVSSMPGLMQQPSGSMSLTDKPMTFAAHAQNSNTHRGSVTTPSNISKSSSSRTQTPFNAPQNISIISDIDTQMARFAPWYAQEQAAKRAEAEESSSGE